MDMNSIAKWTSVKLSSDYIEVVTDDNVSDFVTVNPQYPKVLLFSEKTVSPPLMKRLAYEYREKIKIGVVLNSSNSKLKSKLSVTELPSLVHVTDIENLKGDIYGKLTKSSVISHFSKILQKNKEKQGPYGSSWGSFRQLTKKVMESGECAENDGQHCFLLFRKNEDEVLTGTMKAVAEKYKRDALKIFWVDRNQQAKFEASFTHTCKNCENVFVVYRPKRRRWAELMGRDLTYDAVDSFVESVTSGVIPLKNNVVGKPVLT
eukprot:GHVL01041585.1.p1 GENE.GHVL01041585.1~~GHVL01041585.1.p1  ORF type:complete len:262 (+),score=52.98 GHVL01041585.1:322-1107(+)